MIGISVRLAEKLSSIQNSLYDEDFLMLLYLLERKQEKQKKLVRIPGENFLSLSLGPAL